MVTSTQSNNSQLAFFILQIKCRHFNMDAASFTDCVLDLVRFSKVTPQNQIHQYHFEFEYLIVLILHRSTYTFHKIVPLWNTTKKVDNP